MFLVHYLLGLVSYFPCFAAGFAVTQTPARGTLVGIATSCSVFLPAGGSRGLTERVTSVFVDVILLPGWNINTELELSYVRLEWTCVRM